MQFTRWDQQFSQGESDNAIQKLALLFVHRITNASLQREIHDLVSNRDVRGMCNFTVDYQTTSVSDVINIRQALAFHTKNGDQDIGLDRKALTLQKLRKAELRCKETNDIFTKWKQGRFQFRPRVEACFHSAAQFIASTLGDVPRIQDLKFRFGPGSTTNVVKSKASRYNKLAERFTCSEDLLPIVHHILAEMPHWTRERSLHESRPLVERVEYLVKGLVTVATAPAKLGFAPKNALSFRTTCTQPSISMMYQLALEEVLAEKSASIGLDIHDQTLNQRLAREGSLTNEIATLDLISASDCKAKGLVEHLLPLPWHELLSYGRTSYIKLPDEKRPIYSEQFSSMGNGFTFPLMSLILYALVRSVTPKRLHAQVNVFGDDIVCPSSVVPAVRELLDAAGFWVNELKSYTDGCFRESCGHDYMNGVNVRPVYVKTHLTGMSLFTLHNFFRRGADDEAADLCLEFIHPSLQIWGPDGYGDGHLLTPLAGWGGMSEFAQGGREKWGTRKPAFARNGFDGATFRTYTTQQRRDYVPAPGDYVYPLYTIYADGTTDQPNYQASGHRVSVVSPYGPDYRFRSDKPLRAIVASTVRIKPAEFTRFLDVEIEEQSPDNTSEAPLMETVLPGWKGYKEIRIYTLSRW